MVVRELSGGVYFGEPRGLTPTEAFNTWRQTADEVERVAHVAFRLARGRRRNASPRWTRPTCSRPRACGARVVTEVAQELSRTSSSSTATWTPPASSCSQAPQRFDVVLTENLFGDILSDEAGRGGGLASASCRRPRSATGPSLYEPVHGSAPDPRRPRHREPDGRHPHRGHDARALARPARPRPRRQRRRGRDAARAAHAGHRRHRDHRRVHGRRPAQPVLGALGLAGRGRRGALVWVGRSKLHRNAIDAVSRQEAAIQVGVSQERQLLRSQGRRRIDAHGAAGGDVGARRGRRRSGPRPRPRTSAGSVAATP